MRTLRVLPVTVPAAIDLAGQGDRLAIALDTLSGLYERQAETRARVIPTVLTPLSLALIATVIGLMIMALLMPLIRIIHYIAGP